MHRLMELQLATKILCIWVEAGLWRNQIFSTTTNNHFLFSVPFLSSRNKTQLFSTASLTYPGSQGDQNFLADTRFVVTPGSGFSNNFLADTPSSTHPGEHLLQILLLLLPTRVPTFLVHSEVKWLEMKSSETFFDSKLFYPCTSDSIECCSGAESRCFWWYHSASVSTRVLYGVFWKWIKVNCQIFRSIGHAFWCFEKLYSRRYCAANLYCLSVPGYSFKSFLADVNVRDWSLPKIENKSWHTAIHASYFSQ